MQAVQVHTWDAIMTLASFNAPMCGIGVSLIGVPQRRGIAGVQCGHETVEVVLQCTRTATLLNMQHHHSRSLEGTNFSGGCPLTYF